MLMKSVAQYAKEEGASRIDLHCSTRDPNMEFFNKVGASDLTCIEKWHSFRFQMDAIDRIIAEPI